MDCSGSKLGGTRLVHHEAETLEGIRGLVTDQIPQQDDSRKVLEGSTDEDRSIYSCCLPLFSEEEWSSFSSLQSPGVVKEESGKGTNEVEGVRESKISDFDIQSDRTNLLESKYTGKDNEEEGGLGLAQSSGSLPLGSLAPEVNSNVMKHRGRPHTLHKPANIPVRPMCAAARRQTLPKQELVQHRPKETRGLPDGWIIEEKVREIGVNVGYKDKVILYYLITIFNFLKYIGRVR